MHKFYLLLWFRWAVRLTICSISLAALSAFLITLYTYIYQGTPTLNSVIFNALVEIFKFWFPIFWSVTLLLVLFRGLKYIFNNCVNGFEMKLLTCSGDDIIQTVGYGDLLKVWRRWFMLNIWLVGSFMILALVYTNLFTSYSGVFEWFNIYWLFCFILLSGYLSFILLGARCKQVKVVKC